MGSAKSNIPGAYDADLIVDNSGKIHTPILFYYPEFGQCDLIQDAHEDHTLHSHAFGLLERGLPWDVKKHYLESSYEIWVQLNAAPAVPEHAKHLQKENTKKRVKRPPVTRSNSTHFHFFLNQCLKVSQTH